MLFNLDLVLTDSHSSWLWCRTLYVTWQLNLEYQSPWLSQVFPVASAWYHMQLWFTLLTFLFQRSSANLRRSLAHLIVPISRKHGQTSWDESSVFWAAGSVWMPTWWSHITRHTFTLKTGSPFRPLGCFCHCLHCWNQISQGSSSTCQWCHWVSTLWDEQLARAQAVSS
jgi:hypothetical protein